MLTHISNVWKVYGRPIREGKTNRTEWMAGRDPLCSKRWRRPDARRQRLPEGDWSRYISSSRGMLIFLILKLMYLLPLAFKVKELNICLQLFHGSLLWNSRGSILGQTPAPALQGLQCNVLDSRTNVLQQLKDMEWRQIVHWSKASWGDQACFYWPGSLWDMVGIQ